MPQYESVPHGYSWINSSNHRKLELSTNHYGSPFTFTFECVRRSLFRTTFTSKTHPLPPYPSAEMPKSDIQERNIATHLSKTCATFTVGEVEAQVTWDHSPVVSLRFQGANVLHKDLLFRGYAVDGSGIARYATYDQSALHVGLGEKAAPMDLSGRFFQINAMDAFGYDAYQTDPLYKQIPFLIAAKPNGCVAQFSTSHARGSWSVGCELDGLWGRYKVYRQDHGGLEEYIIIGKTLKDVLHEYAVLVGMPLLVPRWAMGYIAGGYRYTSLDDPPAWKALEEFARKIKEHDIPCSGFQMSSGYHVSEQEPKVRNVFHWNHHRFPDPEKFIRDFHQQGIRLIANVKPFLLRSHPDFDDLIERDSFFQNPATNDHGFTRLWSNGGGESGEGCYLDFTSQAAREFWSNGIKSLRKQGIDVPWNDNNEISIPSDEWLMRLDSVDLQQAKIRDPNDKRIGLWGRAMHTELMGKASHDALKELEPNRRPFVLTRCATAGTMKYCCSTWSGDNVTSWESIKGGNAISLSQGLSLLHCAGHDVGGFEGPQPTQELLVRWVQHAIYSPRFAINSFKTSSSDNRVGEVIEPWMHFEVTYLIRKAIKRRYELIPFLYSLLLESHLLAVPPQRWVGWGYESDPEVWTPYLKRGESQFWLGDNLLIAGVYKAGETKSRIYLPRSTGELDEGFWDIHNTSGQYYSSGQWVEIDSVWHTSIPVLAKAGSAIPVGKPVQTKSVGETTDPLDLPIDDYRGVEIYPPPSFASLPTKKYKTSWYEDDGISAEPKISTFSVEYSCNNSSIQIRIESGAQNVFRPEWHQIHVILPIWEHREVIAFGNKTVKDFGLREDGRRVYVTM